MPSQGPCIEICQGPECGEFGGPELLDELRSLGIAAEPGHCQGLCHYAPVAVVGEKHLGDATAGKVRNALSCPSRIESMPPLLEVGFD